MCTLERVQVAYGQSYKRLQATLKQLMLGNQHHKSLFCHIVLINNNRLIKFNNVLTNCFLRQL